MDTALIEKAMTEKSKCIWPIHLYGQCVNMKSVNDIAGAYGL